VIFVKKLISHVCACAWYKADFKETLPLLKYQLWFIYIRLWQCNCRNSHEL